MTCGEAVREAAGRLGAAGVESPQADARALAQDAFGMTAARLIASAGEPAPADGLARLRDFVLRRAAGEPVARILGRREFWGMTFRLAPETLVPRPDTETIIEAALAQIGARDRQLRVLDLGTGSGCILIALLAELPSASGLGIDLSIGAAAAARDNAAALGVSDRASFVVGRWAEAISGRFDVVASNPPYIARGDIEGLDREVSGHDPMLALDGGADGLDAYRAILADLSRLLRPGGIAVLELGAGQAGPVSEEARRAGLTVIETRADLAATPRALTLGVA